MLLYVLGSRVQMSGAQDGVRGGSGDNLPVVLIGWTGDIKGQGVLAVSRVPIGVESPH